MRLRIRRGVPAPAALAPLLLLCACGPTITPEIAVNTVPLDITLGRPPVVAPHSVPLPATPNFPSLTQLPSLPSLPPLPGFTGTGLPSPGPSTTQSVCPQFDPTAPASGSADETVDGAALNGLYLYRADPTDYIKQNGLEIPFPQTIFSLVTGVANPSQGVYTYTSQRSIDGYVFTSTYQSEPSAGGVDVGGTSAGTAELGLARLEISVPGHGTVKFDLTPQGVSPSSATMLDMLKLPPDGATYPTTSTSPSPSVGVTGGYQQWNDARSDSADGSSMTITGQVVGSGVNVNACGQRVEAWPVQASLQLIAGPPVNAPQGTSVGTTNLTITTTYYVTTSFGGLIVQESSTTFSGTLDGDSGFSMQLNDTINSLNPLTSP